MLRIKDIFNDDTSAFFLEFYNYCDANELPCDYITSDDTQLLDLYFLANYKYRLISPLVYNFLVDGELPNANLVKLVKIIYLKYGAKWQHMFETMQPELYNALEDLNIVETKTPNLTNTIKTQTNIGETTQNNANTFQSSNSTPISDTNKTTSGLKQNNEIEDKKTGTETKRTNGNNRKTKQELLLEEINVRKYNLYDIILGDLAYELTLEIYD